MRTNQYFLKIQNPMSFLRDNAETYTVQKGDTLSAIAKV